MEGRAPFVMFVVDLVSCGQAEDPSQLRHVIVANARVHGLERPVKVFPHSGLRLIAHDGAGDDKDDG